MKSSLSLTDGKSLNPTLFFFLLFIYQVLFTFQGFDLSDEGFFGTFYQQVFKHPEAVQYNFMFWLSGIAGGIWTFFFGDLGVWGLRVLTALTTTATIILTYNLLKKYLKPGNLQLGLLIVTLAINGNTKVFHYDNLSVLFYVITATLLAKALQKDRPVYFLLAGLFIALDTFTRLPSIVNIGLVLAIFYYGFIQKTSFKKQLGQAILFGSGFLVGIAAVLLAMKMTGHLTIFLNAVKLVGKLGSGGEESAYGFMKLIKQFITAYFASVKIAAIVLILLLLAAIAVNLAKTTVYYRKWMARGITVFIIVVILYFLREGAIDHFIELYFLTGLILIAGVLMLFSKADKDLKLLMFMGCFILLAYPLGSGAGLYSAGIYSLWIGFPIALDYFSHIRTLTAQVTVENNITKDAGGLVNEQQFSELRKLTWIICIVTGLYYSWYYPFFDYHERTKMTSEIDNKYLRHIYTTKERSAIMNDLLHESAKYIKPGDYVLAYYSIPMFHYATKTVPFVHNSMPWFYPPDVFREELDSAVQNTKILPVVVMQKRKMTGLPGGGWPDPPPYYDAEWYKKNIPRDSTLQLFLQTNHYSKVWENEMFSIMLPPGK